MSLYGRLFSRVGPSGFGHRSTADDVIAGMDLTGRTYLVTGCNSGLGLETVRVLADHGATVLGTARSAQKASEACEPWEHARPFVCELGEPASVRACVAAVRETGRPLDGIIANAGIMALPRREVIHGVEKQLFVNHVGHMMLVTGLLDSLTDRGRVVMLSSSAHTNPPPDGIHLADLSFAERYNPWKAYGQSKLANLLFARELARRMEGTERIACAVHPGVIGTNLGRHMGPVQYMKFLLSPLFLKSIPEGTATQVWAAVSADPERIHGQYCYDCNVQESSVFGRDLQLAAQLWEASEALIADLPT